MVSKSLIHKKIYENIDDEKDLPEMEVDQIAQILIDDPRGIPNCAHYEMTSHGVNFRNVMEGSRKDIVFHYKEMSRKPIYDEPGEFEGIKYGIISDYKQYERITKVDHVSFFTKLKDRSSEHRIYQIGARYLNKELYRYEDLRRNQEKEGDLNSAINTIRKELEIDADDNMKWRHLAELLYEMKQYDEAIETCKKTLENDGRSSETWNILGMVYYQKGNVDRAIAFLNKAIEEYPQFMKGFKNLALIYFKQGDYESALECCYENIEIDTTEGKLWSQEVIKIKNDIKKLLLDNSKKNPEDITNKFMLAEIYYNDEEFAISLQFFNDIIIKDSKHVDALVYKGLIHDTREEYDHALNAYNLALNIEPEDATILYNLGLVYFNKEDFLKAETMFKRAIEIKPNDLGFRHDLAVTRLNLKDPKMKTNSYGLILDENLKTHYGKVLMSFFHKDFIAPMVSANRHDSNFMNFFQNTLGTLNFEYETYCGLEGLKQLVINNISTTKTLIHMILPLILPEFLSYVSEYAYKEKEAKFVLISHWDMNIYGEILSKMITLGNIQIRQLAFSSDVIAVMKDKEELILAPISNNLENLLCIRIRAPEIVNFFNQVFFPLYMGQSRPIS